MTKTLKFSIEIEALTEDPTGILDTEHYASVIHDTLEEALIRLSFAYSISFNLKKEED